MVIIIEKSHLLASVMSRKCHFVTNLLLSFVMHESIVKIQVKHQKVIFFSLHVQVRKI